MSTQLNYIGGAQTMTLKNQLISLKLDSFTCQCNNRRIIDFTRRHDWNCINNQYLLGQADIGDSWRCSHQIINGCLFLSGD